MKPPVTNVVGHLVWNSAGQVWAVYRVTPAGQMHQTIEHRRGVFDRLRSAFMRLPVESQLLSVSEVMVAAWRGAVIRARDATLVARIFLLIA